MARSEVCLFSFAASCEGRTFGDEKGWRAARCDGVITRNLLIRFLIDSVQELCNSLVLSLCCMENGEEEKLLVGDFF
jgi:hypothetical protein